MYLNNLMVTVIEAIVIMFGKIILFRSFTECNVSSFDENMY